MPCDFLCLLSTFSALLSMAWIPWPPHPRPLSPGGGEGRIGCFLQRVRLSRSFALPRPGGEGRTFRGAKRDDQISNSRAGLRPSHLLRKTQDAQNRRRQESHQSNRGQSTRVQRLRAARVRIAEEGLGKKTTPTPNEIRCRRYGTPERGCNGSHNERSTVRGSRSRHATREKTRSLALADP